MKTIRGDIIDMATAGDFDVIAHGCNCFCTMGKGLALQIKEYFPEAYEVDCETDTGYPDKLGTCTAATINLTSGKVLDVVNAYTQFHYRGRESGTDYEALRGCMQHIKKTYAGKRIGLPKIGAGLGGGDWAIISAIIEEELAGEDVTIVVLG
jgi:O-acetyl-ADP-ribose deacetylase (regulator of RNase III)